MSDDEMPRVREEDEASEAADLPAPAAGSDEELPKGISKTIVKRAPDDNWKRPKAGDDVTVHYVGTLEADGSEFDSSRARNEPLTFTLGRGQVIKGWDLGVATMKQGEIAKFSIAPEFAYGAAGSPPKIPADAALSFEVELLSWVSKEDLFQDGGVIKVQVTEGEGWRKPQEDDEVTFSLKVTSKDGAVLEEKQGLEYAIGSGTLGAFSPVADKALLSMKKDEEVQLTCTGDYAYGENRDGVSVRLKLERIYETADVSFKKDKSVIRKTLVEGEGYQTPNEASKVKLSVQQATDGSGAALPGFAPADLEFVVGNGEVCDALELAVRDMKKKEQAMITCTDPALCQEQKLGLKDISAPKVVLVVQLREFDRKDTWKMSEDEKLDFGNARKEVGSSLFKAGRLAMAFERYRKVGDMFQYVSDLSEENQARARSLKQACDLNMAACHLKWQDFAAAKEACQKVLEDEPGSVKALFRRALADFELKNFEECQRDLKRVLELEPHNQEARKRLRDARASQKEVDVKSKGMFAKMCQGLGKEPHPRKRSRTAAADAPATGGDEKPAEATAQPKDERPKDVEQPDVNMEPAAHEPQVVAAH